MVQQFTFADDVSPQRSSRPDVTHLLVPDTSSVGIYNFMLWHVPVPATFEKHNSPLYPGSNPVVRVSALLVDWFCLASFSFCFWYET